MTGWHKSVRALFAALITTLLAQLMHVGAGGDFSVLGTGFVFVFVLWAAMILAGRRLGHLSLMAIIGLGQILMHVSMGWFGSMSHAAGQSAGSPQMAGMSASEHAMMSQPAGSLDLSQAAAMSQTMDHSNGAGVPMVIAHLVAIVITAFILKRGEDLVFSILQLAVGPVLLAMRALVLARRTLAAADTRVVLEVCALPATIATAVIGPNYRRGPPALV
ncbi:hypothetical protein [Brevibacterium casei]|uniref:Uncharacterized protein n=1 Tax=Brevibacterium casei TaxID=33889 RepID=A0AB34XSN8_9MICO|nr:hypothetical protein [Brevibacterium casei]KZE21577.1 hypothetical protein AVW13_08935 [Brevibacterium casei]MBE4695039.1 hypothetical protein [Brevibacterium casei]MBY3578161.1 hypothetical protein [Brevibacterium casei]MCT1449013.1 hypothetical protein [Brevibacterium casei]MCT1766358.1 hypothetical protein [Brevibacterium casei]